MDTEIRMAPSDDRRLVFINLLMWSSALIETLRALCVAALLLGWGLALLYLMADQILVWIVFLLVGLTPWVRP